MSSRGCGCSALPCYRCPLLYCQAMHSLVKYRDETSGPVMLWKYGSWEEWESREGKGEMFELQYDWPWRKLLAFKGGGAGMPNPV